MRFATVVVRPKQPAPAPAPESTHQRVPAELAVGTPPVAPLRPQEVPADLDQRVRLIGEW
jgi:hypothetical protein